MDKHDPGVWGFAFVQVQTMDRAPWMGEIPWRPQGRAMPVNPAPTQPSTFVVEPWMLNDEDRATLNL